MFSIGIDFLRRTHGGFDWIRYFERTFSSLRPGQELREHDRWRLSQRREAVLKKRIFGDEAGKPANVAGRCPKCLEGCKELWDFLALTRYPEDGSERTPGTLTVFVEDGVVKVSIADKDVSASLYFTADQGLPLLAQAEAQLKDEKATWRRWGGKKKKGN